MVNCNGPQYFEVTTKALQKKLFDALAVNDVKLSVFQSEYQQNNSDISTVSAVL